MKKALIASSVFIAVMVFCFSCETPQGPVEQPTETEQVSTPNYQDTIHLATFNAWTANWQKNGQRYIADLPPNAMLKYFDLPLVDFTELFTENPSGTRFYFGLDEKNTPHLIVVGTDSKGQNMLNPKKGEFAYDVSSPCPPVCI